MISCKHTIEENDARIFFLFGCLFFLDWLMAPYLNCDALIACEWLALIAWIIYRRPNFFIRYILLLFWLGANLTGVLICEDTTVWLDELGVRAHHAGSLGLVSLAWFLWLAVVFFLDQRFPYRLESDEERYAWKITWRGREISVLSLLPYMMLAVLLVLFLHIRDHPFFMEHIDRFIFRKKYLDGLWNNLANVCHFMLPLFLLQWFREKKKWIWIPWGMYYVFLFWTGEKFGRYWESLVFACLLFSVFYHDYPAYRLRRGIYIIAGSFLLLLGITFLHHMAYTERNFTDYFYQRAAQQGQLWWRTYDKDRGGPLRITEVAQEAEVFFRTNDSNEKKYNHGIYKVMRYVTPADIFQRKIGSGSVYTTSNHATYYYYFKEWGVLLLSMLSGCFFWSVVRAWMYCASHGFVLETILATRIFILFNGVLVMSRLFELMSYKGILYIVVLAALLFFRLRCRPTGYFPDRRASADA